MSRKNFIKNSIDNAWKNHKSNKRYAAAKRIYFKSVSNSKEIKFSSALSLISIVYNNFTIEKFLAFVSYYNKIGINEFLFLTNHDVSIDDSIVNALSDCNVTFLALDEGASQIDCINYLLSTYRDQRWTLLVKDLGIFIYPFSNTRTLLDLTSYLKSIRECAMSSVAIFSDELEENHQNNGCSKEINILRKTICRSFNEEYRNNHVFNLYEELNSPKVSSRNQVNLVLWDKQYYYKELFSRTWPRRLENGLSDKKVIGSVIDADVFDSDINVSMLWQSLLARSVIHSGEWSK
ncbi:hypothetical protein LMG33818_001649 [Halomonadaceae bacterium LMG 33818]|uniref:hypothetical protein n=1 Tax=Cernens ardua TaxID=3402176 RepID=UPI003EDBF2BC